MIIIKKGIKRCFFLAKGGYLAYLAQKREAPHGMERELTLKRISEEPNQRGFSKGTSSQY